MSRRGVWELSTPRLEQLLAALRRRAGEAITIVGLQQDGFDPAVCGGLAGWPAPVAALVVESVLAERTVRPRPELELVWTGREGGATLSRDTSQILPQLFLIRDAEFAARVSGQWRSLVTQGLFRGHGREAEGAL